MVPLAVDPQALFAAGSAVVAAGDGLAANLSVLTAGFAVNTGHDMAGEVFGLAYQDAAGSLLKAATAAINACRHCGALIQQGACNYSRAEAASTLGGGAGVLEAPAEPVKLPAPGPPGTLGAGQPPPLLWEVVESFVDGTWPDGDAAGMHTAAGRWRGFAAAASGMRGALSASKALFDGQQIPEGGKIDEALSQIGDCIANIGEQCGKLASSLDGFADEVSQSQNSIRDLVHRLGSLANPVHDVILVFEGDAIDEIKKIANDVNGVLHTLGREARAREQGLKMAMQLGDGLVVKFEKFMRGQLTKFLGNDVGNAVSMHLDFLVNLDEGLLKGAVGTAQGIVDLDPGWFLIDPKGASALWTGMMKTGLLYHFINPQGALEADKQMLKGLLHLDDWSTARPGLGLGENIFDIGTLFIPGAGEAGAAADGAGAAARGAEAAADASAQAERAGGIAADGVAAVAGVRVGLGDIAKTGGDLTKNLESISADVPKIDPAAGGTPVALPGGKPMDPPVESAPRPPDTAAGAPHGPAIGPEPRPCESAGDSRGAPAGGPMHDPAPAPTSLPAGRTHEPVSVPGGAPLTSAPARMGERVMSTPQQLGEHTSAGVPVSPGAAPAAQPPAVAAHSPQPAPSVTSGVPHSVPTGGRPTELPTPGRGWHGNGDGSPPRERPDASSHDGDGARGPGNGSPGEPKNKPMHDGNGQAGLGHGDIPGGSERRGPVHSDDPSGAGWHRLGDEPVDPDYGKPLDDHWDYPYDPTDMSHVSQEVRDLMKDPEAPFGRDPHGHAYSPTEYAQRFNKLGPDGEHWYNFPGNSGAGPLTRVAYSELQAFIRDYGARLDRIGDDEGTYLAVMENGEPASWEERALHVNSLRDPYNAYTISDLPEKWSIEVSEVAPGLGQRGGSLQVRIFDTRGAVRKVDDLIGWILTQ
ncbi:glycohydrolase toxin TNT-related protein [Mycobacterium sp.]|uniref:glycohydrolase toxin TNT-related protein n=1 Tax=Mycobacterium sp. TaxID=1785 RepID=UPI0025E5B5E1|nr:glycohydrolase toxin TNT-related protein [Mycobacterium sp.]MBW0015290.1 glycohydrolase toxin TNT-related protein [Mycobacterium sp.]